MTRLFITFCRYELIYQYDLLLSRRGEEKKKTLPEQRKLKKQINSDVFFSPLFLTHSPQTTNHCHLNKNDAFMYPINLFLEFYFCLSWLTNINLLFSYQKKQKRERKNKRFRRDNKQKKEKHKRKIATKKKKKTMRMRHRLRSAEVRSSM